MEDSIKRFPLIKEFRFIHGTIPVNSSLKLKYSDNSEEEKEKLIHRIINTETGGCFLITGYRGVGKTCFVDEVIQEICNSEKNTKGKSTLWIKLNLARDLTSLNLMHQIIRNFYEVVEREKESIKDKNVWKCIQKAYLRTILKMKSSSEAAQKELLSKAIHSSAVGEIKGGILGFLSGRVKTGILGKRDNSKEDAYRQTVDVYDLDYDEKTAESDIIRIAELLKRANHMLVVVLDEIDKLIESDTPERGKNIESIVSALKNVFSASGLIFLLVAGKEFYDIWVEDRKKEDSIYESIFSYDFYISKDWDIGARMLKKYVPGEDKLENFGHYLNYAAKGILRKAFHEFNKFVTWEDGKAYLELSEKDVKKITFYGNLQKILQDEVDKTLNGLEKTPLSTRKLDKLRYIIYERVIGKILEGRSFDAGNLQDELIQNFKEEEHLIKGIFQPLLKILENNGWLEKEEAMYCLAKKKVGERADFEGSREVFTQIEKKEGDQRIKSEQLTRDAERLIDESKESEGEQIVPINMEKVKDMLVDALKLWPENKKARILWDEEIEPYISYQK